MKKKEEPRQTNESAYGSQRKLFPNPAARPSHTAATALAARCHRRHRPRAMLYFSQTQNRNVALAPTPAPPEKNF
ncbi:MAG: hypothetical protein LBT53_09730 [Puniceicoccales bacterium]|nr:hypothetical protein [Puniceicoccales bacterium]